MARQKKEVKRVPYREEYCRLVDTSLIPTCNILGTGIAAIDMPWLVDYVTGHLKEISGDYICVANVHTTITAMEDQEYLRIQNGGLMSIPDGGPLTSEGKRQGFSTMKRTTGPKFMEEVFKISAQNGYRHYFYGSKPETLDLVRQKLEENYPGLQIAGMMSPPFRELTGEEEERIVRDIKLAAPDFIWVGLGAPKQEKWMATHQGMFPGLMIGVGAGFSYIAGLIKRAPKWMQERNLEWLYRLIQDPIRLFRRYWHTNTRFIYYTVFKRR